MGRSSYRTLLLAGAAAFGIGGLAPSASASAVVNSADFTVVESCVLADGCSGDFTVINNSNGDGNWYIWAFSVGNPNVISDDTTQTGWTASLGCFSGSCTGNDAFEYSNTAGASHLGSDLANDVGPGESSSNFTFTSELPNSPVDLSVVNTDGTLQSVSITATDSIPESASLAVLGRGLLGLFRVRGRRRTRR